MPFDPRTRPLSPTEARVLATLMEKARTVPDSYPLTLNAVVTGCNQKSSRDPVMQLTDAQVQEALDALRLRTLAVEIGGNRATKFEHNFPRGIGVPDQSAVLLALLMLRGPQTAGELRITSERWHRFADISSVEAFLDELQSRSDEKGGPLVMQLPRAPGAREQRWAHLLCGPVDASQYAAGAAMASAAADGPAAQGLASRVAALEAEVAGLRATVQRLCQELGLPPEPTAPVSPPGQA
ncbi:YceH family protein [Acidovorax sp. SUPP3334]|uniref:YceH family protein n=1 Tax=Acidovorax sp. SUPP3334 TaxID=2920881 RepID=UPI0023DE4F97|nr:YceH family protein [Acidovorax sp. SUPP3334]GKT24097.1 YceH family protein [Acidovorax sp. SUPP3334]